MADAHKNSELDIAWAAGLFEGEGCIVVSKHRGRWSRIVLTLGTTDRDVLERFALVVGVGTINIRVSDNTRWRDFHVWTTHGKKAAPVLEMFLPLLGDRRSAKAREALLQISSIGVANGEKTHCAQGHPYDAENTRITDGARHCRTCERVWNRRRRSAS